MVLYHWGEYLRRLRIDFSTLLGRRDSQTLHSGLIPYLHSFALLKPLTGLTFPHLVHFPICSLAFMPQVYHTYPFLIKVEGIVTLVRAQQSLETVGDVTVTFLYRCSRFR